MIRKSIPFIFALAFISIALSAFTFLNRSLAQPSIENLQNINESIEHQKQFILQDINDNNSVSAKANLEKLIVDYGNIYTIVPAVYEIAEAYRSTARFASAITASQFILANFPENEKAIWAQRTLAASYIGLKDYVSAQAAVDKLLMDYSNNPNITQVIYEVADAYCRFEKNRDAQFLYQKIIDTWPSSEHAMWSQMGLAITYIADSNDDIARQATDTLVANYTSNETLPEALIHIAARYVLAKKYYKGLDIYSYIIEQFPESTWAEIAKFESAKVAVYPFIDANDTPNALIAIDTLIAEFKEKSELPAAVYDFAARVDWKNKHEPNDLTQIILNRVIEHFPQDLFAKRAQVSLLRMDLLKIVLSEGDANEVMAGIEYIAKDYNSIPESIEDLFIIAERFSGKGWEGRISKNEVKATMNWRKDVEVREQIIEHFPKSPYLAKAHYTTGIVLAQNLMEYEKGIKYLKKVVENWPEYQYVWHAQYFLGMYSERLKKEKNISDQNLDLQIEQAYQDFIEKYPEKEGAEMAYKKLGWHYFTKGDYNNSSIYYKMFLDKSPEKIDEVVNPLGLSYEYTKQPEKAIQIYKEFLESTQIKDSRIDTIKARIQRLERGVP